MIGNFLAKSKDIKKISLAVLHLLLLEGLIKTKKVAAWEVNCF